MKKIVIGIALNLLSLSLSVEGEVVRIYAIEQQEVLVAVEDVLVKAETEDSNIPIVAYTAEKKIGEIDISQKQLEALIRIGKGLEEDIGPFQRECDRFILLSASNCFFLEVDTREPKAMWISKCTAVGKSLYFREIGPSNIGNIEKIAMPLFRFFLDSAGAPKKNQKNGQEEGLNIGPTNKK